VTYVVATGPSVVDLKRNVDAVAFRRRIQAGGQGMPVLILRGSAVPRPGSSWQRLAVQSEAKVAFDGGGRYERGPGSARQPRWVLAKTWVRMVWRWNGAVGPAVTP
jgi:hypothetical protein